jgi:hypothetical protein
VFCSGDFSQCQCVQGFLLLDISQKKKKKGSEYPKYNSGIIYMKPKKKKDQSVEMLQPYSEGGRKYSQDVE